MSVLKRKTRVRKKLGQVSQRPRLSVHRTNKHIYAQIIDDTTGKTVAASSSKNITSGTKSQKAEKVGADIAKKALKAKVGKVKFDRGQYKYHGRVKAVSEAARQEGLEF